MQAPKVSVGFPVYNGEKYLANALGELTSQEYENFELIIADNASTDRTEEICREFAARDQRIRYLRNPRNIGLAANHNLTVELARGEFFKWAAHDDGFPPAMLRRLVDVLQAAPKSVCVAYSFCEYIDQNGNVIGMDSDGVALDDSRPHKRLSHLLWRVHMFNCPYGLMRTEVLRQTRLHGLFPMADHVLMAELAMLGVLVEVPEPLLRIRRHPGRSFDSHTTPEALRELFNPGRGERFSLLSLTARTHLEIIRSAMRIPTNARDKALCTAVAAAVPQWRSFRGFGGMQKRKLLQLLGQLNPRKVL